MTQTFFRSCPFCGAEMGRMFCDTPGCDLSLDACLAYTGSMRREWAAHKPNIVHVTLSQMCDAFKAAVVATEKP